LISFVPREILQEIFVLQDIVIEAEVDLIVLVVRMMVTDAEEATEIAVVLGPVVMVPIVIVAVVDLGVVNHPPTPHPRTQTALLPPVLLLNLRIDYLWTLTMTQRDE
jgi:hypothetical protein